LLRRRYAAPRNDGLLRHRFRYAAQRIGARGVLGDRLRERDRLGNAARMGI
jgi:hypothetical protein